MSVEKVSEARPLPATSLPLRKIVMDGGGVVVIFRRSDQPSVVVTGNTAEVVSSTETRFENGKLVIHGRYGTVSGGYVIRDGSNYSVQNFMGSASMVAGRDIYCNGKRIETGNIVEVTGYPGVLVEVSLPECPAIKLKGSGDAILQELDQENLELEIVGSGDIDVSGQVQTLMAKIIGSGDIDALELIAEQADLRISGSGDIEAFVTQAVSAVVQGSGDIRVKGNPPKRSKQVLGSGSIKISKKKSAEPKPEIPVHGGNFASQDAAQIAIARKLIQRGRPIEEIAEDTGLPVEKIRTIQP
jgi:hypothetical protein